MAALKVLLTRAPLEASESAQRLRQAGFDPVTLPLIEYEEIGGALPEGLFDAVVFTSAAAVRFLRERIGRSGEGRDLLQLPAWCVGNGTSAAARKAGFATVHSADGDGRKLASLMSEAYRDATRPRILYPCGRERAVDLAELLPSCDIVLAEIYAVRQRDPGRERLSSALAAVEDGAVLLYSPRSARNLLDLANRHGLGHLLRDLMMIAISDRTRDAVAGLKRVRVAMSPDEGGMIAALRELAEERGPC